MHFIWPVSSYVLSLDMLHKLSKTYPIRTCKLLVHSRWISRRHSKCTQHWKMLTIQKVQWEYLGHMRVICVKSSGRWNKHDANIDGSSNKIRDGAIWNGFGRFQCMYSKDMNWITNYRIRWDTLWQNYFVQKTADIPIRIK